MTGAVGAPVGVLGATGAVGRAVVGLLDDAGVPTTPASRRGGPDGRHSLVDVTDAEGVSRFADSCSVVVDCTGPASELAGAVAALVSATGTPYVTPGETRPEELPGPGGAVWGAGMVPGLSELLPRALATDLGRPRTLTAYVGGCESFSPAAARDYVSGALGSPGRTRAAWRHGHLVPAVLRTLENADLPWFPGPVTAVPFLDEGAERLARELGLTEVSWYHVFDGKHARRALEGLRAGRTQQAAEALRSGAELDVLAHGRYQVLLFELRNDTDAHTLVLRSQDSYGLTAEVAVLAAMAAREGRVPPGVHAAGSLLDPAAVLDRMRRSPYVSSLEVVEDHATLEEGAL